MTSRKSLQNNFGYAYRSGLRDNSLFAILNTVFLSLFFVVVPIMTFRNNTSTDKQTGQVSVVNFKEQFSFMFTNSMEMFRYIIIAVLIGVGLLVGITTFKFITGKKTVNVYYSLGIKRQKLFAAKYLSGLTLIAASVLLPMLVSLIINVSVLGTNKFMFPAFFYLTLGMFSVAAVSYTLTAMVFTLVGTVFEGALFSGILILFPEILFQCLQILIQKLVFGTPLGTEFSTSRIYVGNTSASLANTFENFNPLRYFSKGLFTYSLADAKGQVVGYDNGGAVAWSAPKFLPIVLWIAFAALLFLGGLFFYKRRKAEIGGFIGKNRVMNFIGIFLVGIFGFVFSFDLLYTKGMAIAVAVGAVVFAVIYVGLSFLLLRNVRQFVKELPALPVQLAIVALIFVFFSTGYFGAANKIPETAEIQSAQITAPFANYSLVNHGNSTSVSGLPAANSYPYGEYTSEKDINFVRNVHAKLVQTGKTEPTKLDTEFNGTYPVAIKIVYKLKNGKEVLRSYYGVSAEILKELQKADETDYQQSIYKKIFKDEVKVVELPKENEGVSAELQKAYEEYQYIRTVREGTDVRLYNKNLSTETPMVLTAEQHASLLDCLYKDLTAQSPENHYNPTDILGVISFYDAAENMPSDESGTVVMSSSGYVSAEYADKAVSSEADGVEKYLQNNQPDFFITPDMKNTVEFLKSAGYYEQMVSDKELKSVYGIQVSHLFNRDYLDNWIAAKDEDFGCEFLAESSSTNRFGEITGEYEGMAREDRPNVYNTTDKALLETIQKNTVTRSMLSPTDYIVVLAYTDGTYVKTYVRADKMPESAKAGIEKNTPADSFYW